MGTKNNPGKFDCFAKADPDEPMFVLLGRDPLAGQLVVLWALVQEKLGTPPEKIEEALRCSVAMGMWCFEKKGQKTLEEMMEVFAGIFHSDGALRFLTKVLIAEEIVAKDTAAPKDVAQG